MAALAKGVRVGIDIERVETRSQGFYDFAFSPTERERVVGFGAWDALTKAWTMKEAFSKALGIGLGITLHDIEVKDLRQGSLGLSGQASARLLRDPGAVYMSKSPELPEWASGYVASVCTVEDASIPKTMVNEFISSGAGHPALETGGISHGIR